VSSTRWLLSEEGKAAASRLGEQLAAMSPKLIVTSPEPKAAETAAIIGRRVGLSVSVDDGLVEHRRPDLCFVSADDFEASIRRVFEHPSEQLFGGESADEAYARFQTAVARHSERPLIVVTHGTVLSLFVSRACGVDPLKLWSGLRLPEAFVLDADLRLAARLTAD